MNTSAVYMYASVTWSAVYMFAFGCLVRAVIMYVCDVQFGLHYLLACQVSLETL
jgi:hypothetical protein